MQDDLSNIARDEVITDIALKYNAILVTADSQMKSEAIVRSIFAIFI